MGGRSFTHRNFMSMGAVLDNRCIRMRPWALHVKETSTICSTDTTPVILSSHDEIMRALQQIPRSSTDTKTRRRLKNLRRWITRRTSPTKKIYPNPILLASPMPNHQEHPSLKIVVHIRCLVHKMSGIYDVWYIWCLVHMMSGTYWK